MRMRMSIDRRSKRVINGSVILMVVFSATFKMF